MDISGPAQEGQLDTGASYGVGLRYADIPNNGIGLLGGVNFGWGQFINRAIVTENNVETTKVLEEDQQGDFYYLVTEVNAALGLFGHLYIYAGPNYSMPIKTALPDISMEGDIGFQTGLGVKIVDQFSLEAGYRWLNYTMNDPQNKLGGDFDLARQWGAFARAALLF